MGFRKEIQGHRSGAGGRRPLLIQINAGRRAALVARSFAHAYLAPTAVREKTYHRDGRIESDSDVPCWWRQNKNALSIWLMSSAVVEPLRLQLTEGGPHGPMRIRKITPSEDKAPAVRRRSRSLPNDQPSSSTFRGQNGRENP